MPRPAAAPQLGLKASRQRSALRAARRSTLAYMDSRMTEGSARHPTAPYGQWPPRARGTARRGRDAQQSRSATATCRNQVAPTLRRASFLVTQATITLPDTPNRKTAA